MSHEQRMEVLIVGAGPAGMLCALCLAQEGVAVRLIDQEPRTAARTYACALHPRTLKLLQRLGLSQEVIGLGRRVERVGFYEGETRQAEVRLDDGQDEFPFVLVLPQSAFEDLLEERLRREAGVPVHWSHQLSGLRLEGSTVVATVDRLGVSAKGYIIPEMEWSVERTDELRASFVIGADGPNSFVAKTLGLDAEEVSAPEFFAVFEFQSDWPVRDELRIILDPQTTSVLWPLAGGRVRWGFQLLQEHLSEFPAKERQFFLIGDARQDKAARSFVREMIQTRAPWFNGSIEEMGWSADVEFRPRLARRFGVQHLWLVGDAAHQTGPAAMQSMNVGLREAGELAEAIAQILRKQAPASLLDAYQERSRERWRGLLGLAGPLKASEGTAPWIKERSARLLSCLPASGEDLAGPLSQLGLKCPS